MSIVDQPRTGHTGTSLRNLLTGEEDYSDHEFYMLSAYARRSGVSMMHSAIETFRSRSGRAVAIVGVDQAQTSVQALESLHNMCDEVYVFHNENFSCTYHPKVYVLKHGSEYADVFVGSSNLTGGGMLSNYEAVMHKRMPISNDPEGEEFRQVQSMISAYSDESSECCKRLSIDLIHQLHDLNYVDNEEITRLNALSRGEQEPNEVRARLFGYVQVTPPAARVTAIPRRQPAVRQMVLARARGGFWKKLSHFDVSTTSGPGQIIIPIRFLPLFPTLPPAQMMPSGGQQAEVFFNVIFESSSGAQVRVQHVRAIHYIPAPTHPRPNQELRFTFRSGEVFDRLNEDDLLEFARLASIEDWFLITQVKPTQAQYRAYGQARFGNLTT